MGRRVQYSVFECIVDPAQWAVFRDKLIDEIDPENGQPAVLFSWIELETHALSISEQKKALIRRDR